MNREHGPTVPVGTDKEQTTYRNERCVGVNAAALKPGEEGLERKGDTNFKLRLIYERNHVKPQL